MEKNFKIHIIFSTPDLFLMIKKYFAHTNFIFNSTHLKHPDYISLEELGYTPDCIILDSEINGDLRKKISSTYKKSKVIYLPSLSESESDYSDDKEIFKVSEPLKLSELEKVINNLYSTKISDEN